MQWIGETLEARYIDCPPIEKVAKMYLVAEKAQTNPEVTSLRNSLYNKEKVTVEDINVLTDLISSLEMEILEEMHAKKVHIEGQQPWNVEIETAW